MKRDPYTHNDKRRYAQTPSLNLVTSLLRGQGLAKTGQFDVVFVGERLQKCQVSYIERLSRSDARRLRRGLPERFGRVHPPFA
jgi:hypothetical protein